jgi:hypothetical protein
MDLQRERELMKQQSTSVELLVNPFCMAERDVDSIDRICVAQGVHMKVYDLWNIDDEDLGTLPAYIACLVREWRSGQRPGSVYSSVFVNGERIPLNSWKEHLDVVSEAIARWKKECAR